MAPDNRQLAAIVVADVVGFSRMMARDEDETLSALRAHRNVLDPVVRNRGGRIFKTTGDGFIAEFPSATAALEACIESQRAMENRNQTLPESRRMLFRMGINVGDVVRDDSGDVFGDSVNVAARIEAISEPGGVALSDAVARAVSGKTDADLVDIGERELKNIPRPVRIWRVDLQVEPDTELLTGAVSRRETLATVAVLPFENMSADPEQQYFVDGITEDLISALSYDKYLGVVARNSTFAYKGVATDVRLIAAELDATHVVEGSARRVGSRIRVTAQLIDAETGHHIWSERLDRDLVEIFDLQDELVTAIASKLTPSLWKAQGQGRRRSASVDAWDLTARGEFHYSRFTEEGLLAAIELYDKARALEPDFAAPVAGSAQSWMALYFFGWRRDGVDTFQRGLADAELAHRIDPSDYRALNALAFARCVVGEPGEAKKLTDRMIEINPFAGIGYHWRGLALCILGDYDAAVESYTEAWRLGRHEPWHFDTATDLGYTHYLSGNYDAAIEWGVECLRIQDFLQCRILLAAAYAQANRPEEAAPHVDAVLASRPGFSLTKWRSRTVYTRDEDRDHLVKGLHKAGLPS
jgi:adenylate cyclase